MCVVLCVSRVRTNLSSTLIIISRSSHIVGGYEQWRPQAVRHQTLDERLKLDTGVLVQ